MTTGALESELESDEELRFFSEPPAAEHFDDFAPHSLSASTQTAPAAAAKPLSREQREAAAQFRARRSKLQRRVGAVLGGAVTLLMLGVVVHARAEAQRRLEDSAPVRAATQQQASLAAAPVVQPPARVVAPAPETLQAVPVPPLAAAVPSVVAKEPSVAPAEPSAVPSVTPSAPPAIEKTASESADGSELIRKARHLLNTGHSRDGVAAARDAVAQAPLEAEPYVLLGAGLQDLGRYADARAVFAECLKTATKGPIATCRYFSKQ